MKHIKRLIWGFIIMLAIATALMIFSFVCIFVIALISCVIEQYEIVMPVLILIIAFGVAYCIGREFERNVK